MAMADALRLTASCQAIYAGVGPQRIDALLALKYGTAAPSTAISLVARSGAGDVVLRDTRGLATDALAFDAAGSTGPRERSFQYVEIVSISGGLTVEVYA